MSNHARLVRELTPPLIWNFGKRRLPRLVRALGGHYTHIRFTGDYATFAQARADAAGYDAPNILERTREAVLLVKNGRHRWERDAMISDSEEMHWSLLASLLHIAAASGKRALRVLDFGGSLGSTYYWCRPFLMPAISLRWTVVEQPGHVAVGRADFQSDELHFALNVTEALAEKSADVFLISGVLHFLEDPEAFLEQLRAHRFPYLILDRTPLWSKAHNRLTVQHVPPEIYAATYPAWFLSQARIIGLLERDYELISRAPDTETWELDGEPVPNSLWFFKRREQVDA